MHKSINIQIYTQIIILPWPAPWSRDAPWYFQRPSSILWAMMTVVVKSGWWWGWGWRWWCWYGCGLFPWLQVPSSGRNKNNLKHGIIFIVMFHGLSSVRQSRLPSPRIQRGSWLRGHELWDITILWGGTSLITLTDERAGRVDYKRCHFHLN